MGTKKCTITCLELVGVAEAAELIGLSKSVFCSRLKFTPLSLPQLPKPAARLKCGPIWLRSQIEEYREACKTYEGPRRLPPDFSFNRRTQQP